MNGFLGDLMNAKAGWKGFGAFGLACDDDDEALGIDTLWYFKCGGSAKGGMLLEGEEEELGGGLSGGG